MPKRFRDSYVYDMKKVFIHLPLTGLKKKFRNMEAKSTSCERWTQERPMVDGLVLATIADGFGELFVDRFCPFYTRLFTF